MHEGLLYRYKNEDDFGLPSSSFTVCTFWFINSLFQIGEEEKSKALFDELLSHSNHLGLFSEDIDFESKRLLGNFPQAYSHLALIDNALNFNQITVRDFQYFRIHNGDVAQLARALDWQSRGRGFESLLLHKLFLGTIIYSLR